MASETTTKRTRRQALAALRALGFKREEDGRGLRYTVAYHLTMSYGEQRVGRVTSEARTIADDQGWFLNIHRCNGGSGCSLTIAV